jgi:hypothetical protein
MPVTKEQAAMIADLASAARPHGARRWDAPGIVAALAKVRHLELAEVLMAVGRAARDRDLETPAAIGNPSAPCWIERPIERATPEKTTPDTRCGICGHARERCATAPRFADDDHAFEPDFKQRTGSAVEELRDIKAKALMPKPEDTAEVLPIAVGAGGSTTTRVIPPEEATA